MSLQSEFEFGAAFGLVLLALFERGFGIANVPWVFGPDTFAVSSAFRSLASFGRCTLFCCTHD
jgi:hypothetical protein